MIPYNKVLYKFEEDEEISMSACGSTFVKMWPYDERGVMTCPVCDRVNGHGTLPSYTDTLALQYTPLCEGRDRLFGGEFTPMMRRLEPLEVRNIRLGGRMVKNRLPDMRRIPYNEHNIYLLVPQAATAEKLLGFHHWLASGCATVYHSGFWAALHVSEQRLDDRVVAWWSPRNALVWTLSLPTAHRLHAALT